MRRKTITLIDDLDGTIAAETVRFAIDGHDFEIDLSARNAAKLRQSLKLYTSRAHTAGGQKRTRMAVAAVGESRAAQIRAWAKSQEVKVPARGRIPPDIARALSAAQP